MAESRSGRRPSALGALLVLGAVALLLTGAIIVTYIAYDRQSDRVASLEEREKRIQNDHRQIGAKFASQSRELTQAVKQVRGAYGAGFVDGRRAQRLPTRFRPLGRYVRSGYLVPVRVPKPLEGTRLRIGQRADGYSLRWPGVAFFATRDPLRVWTQQSLGGSVRSLRVAGRRVVRLRGASGVIYAWRQSGRTYAVITLPRAESLARPLIATLR